MIKWEYMFTSLGNYMAIHERLRVFNALGQEGWEYTGEKEDSGFGYRYLFKKPIKE